MLIPPWGNSDCCYAAAARHLGHQSNHCGGGHAGRSHFGTPSCTQWDHVQHAAPFPGCHCMHGARGVWSSWGEAAQLGPRHAVLFTTARMHADKVQGHLDQSVCLYKPFLMASRGMHVSAASGACMFQQSPIMWRRSLQRSLRCMRLTFCLSPRCSCLLACAVSGGHLLDDSRHTVALAAPC